MQQRDRLMTSGARAMDARQTELDPWTQLEQLTQEADPEPIEEFLQDLPPCEQARAVSRLSGETQTQLLTLLPAEDAAHLIGGMVDAQAAELLEHLSPQNAAAIVHELPSNEQVDLLSDLNVPDAEAILAEMDAAAAVELRQLADYPADSAGGLMVTELLFYAATWSVAKVLDDLRNHAERYRDYEVQYAFVTDGEHRLIGVLRLRDLLLAKPSTRLQELMIRDPLTVAAQTGLDELRDVFAAHGYLGVPVVNDRGVLLGLVRRSDVQRALEDRTEDDYRKALGIVKEELRTMPVWVRSRRRLAWLSINILLNVLAASVIAVYQETLAQVIALAVFLPIISDMSGCSGNQAVAVSMRELALGFVKPHEVRRVLLKELSVGILNGLALGILIGAVAVLWKANPFLGLVVGAALALNTLIAVSIGGVLPLFMKLLRMDPALASGPILTTVTDMCGFFIVLSLASALLPWLGNL
jgi:magnesium transporter